MYLYILDASLWFVILNSSSSDVLVWRRMDVAPRLWRPEPRRLNIPLLPPHHVPWAPNASCERRLYKLVFSAVIHPRQVLVKLRSSGILHTQVMMTASIVRHNEMCATGMQSLVEIFLE